MRAPAIITYDAQGVVLGWNAGATALSGHAESDLLGRPLATVLDPPAPTEGAAAQAINGTAVLRTSGGRRLTVERARAPIHDRSGAVVAYSELLNLRASQTDGERPPRDTPPPVQRDSEATRLREIIDTLPQLVWACDEHGACDYASERWHEYVGVPPEQLLGEGWLAYVHPDDRARCKALWYEASEKKCDYRVKARIRRHDGVYRWVDARASARRDESGRALGWFGYNTDIHDTHLLQEALVRERELLERWIATAPGVAYIYRVEPDGKAWFPRLEPGMEDITGVASEELARDAGAAWARVLPEDVETLRESQELAMRDPQPYRAEFRFRHPQRGVVWVETSASPKIDPAGGCEWVGFMRDITQRKQAEQAIVTMQAQLVAALEAGGMGLWQWDVARDALHMDDLLLKLLERRRDELSGTSRDAHAFVAPEDVAAVQAAMRALASESMRRDFEHRVVLPSGQVRWLAVRANSERDEHGAVHQVTALHIDVTQQKRATEAQLHSQKAEALGTLAGGIAHDFNNILQAITGNTTLALLGLPSDHRARNFLNEVTTAVSRASDLVRQILAFSRPDEHPLSEISMADEVGEALKLVRATLPATIAIHVALDAAAPKVAADASRIHQVVVNLATNAAHAVRATGGIIDVRLEAVTLLGGASATAPELPAGRYVALHVRDNGCGIVPASLPRIFDPFYTTKAVGQGTGLGLSVVHGIVKRLGGAVRVCSEVGAGSTFSVYLPTASSAPHEAEQRTSDSAPPLAEGRRVLFVDDEKMLVTLGVGFLKMLGMKPSGFIDPRAAIAAFEAAPQSFDAVVTDAAMPALSGYELAERLLTMRPDLPVIMLSGFVGPAERVRAEQLGVRELLLKPVGIDELKHALARALNGRAQVVRGRTLHRESGR